MKVIKIKRTQVKEITILGSDVSDEQAKKAALDLAYNHTNWDDEISWCAVDDVRTIHPKS